MMTNPHAQNFIDLIHEGNYEAMVSYAIDHEFERWDFKDDNDGHWWYLLAWAAWYAHREGVKEAKDDLEKVFNEGWADGYEAREKEEAEEKAKKG